MAHLPITTPATPTLHRLQLIELAILREFVRLCEAEGLRYYLVGGTLLGAVRHRGFIPWDNDIDVAMPRPDYEAFVRRSGGALPTWLRFQTCHTDAGYPRLFGKLLDTRTTLRQRETAHMDFEQCVYVDVFPLDGVAGGWAVHVQRLLATVCRVRLSASVRRGPVKTILAQLTRVVPRRVAIALFEQMARTWRFSRSERVVNHGGIYGFDREAFPRRWLGDGATLSFEGLRLNAPAASNRYLRHVYGEYMALPPVQHRFDHHENEEIAIPRAAVIAASATLFRVSARRQARRPVRPGRSPRRGTGGSVTRGPGGCPPRT